MNAPRESLFDALAERAAKDPLGIDVSDYSDEFCAGFLAGQVNAVDHVRDLLRDSDPERALRLARVVVERYGRVWAKDTDYYRAAEALGIKEPPDA